MQNLTRQPQISLEANMFPNISCVVHLVLFYFEVEGIFIHTSSCHLEYLLYHFQLPIKSLMFLYFHIYRLKFGYAICVNKLQHLVNKRYANFFLTSIFFFFQDPKRVHHTSATKQLSIE
jgi:hypothetical protein